MKPVPIHPTEAMIQAAEEAHTPFGCMYAAIQSAIIAAPACTDHQLAQVAGKMHGALCHAVTMVQITNPEAAVAVARGYGAIDAYQALQDGPPSPPAPPPPRSVTGRPEPSGQTKRQSLLETLASVAIGYIVAVISQVVILPWFGVELSLSQNFAVALWFTGVSIVRGYVVRRAFNRIWR